MVKRQRVRVARTQNHMAFMTERQVGGKESHPGTPPRAIKKLVIPIPTRKVKGGREGKFREGLGKYSIMTIGAPSESLNNFQVFREEKSQTQGCGRQAEREIKQQQRRVGKGEGDEGRGKRGREN